MDDFEDLIACPNTQVPLSKITLGGEKKKVGASDEVPLDILLATIVLTTYDS